MTALNKRSLGSSGEDIAQDFLIKNNYEITTHNFRFGRFGEIDIIANENGYICFIEVKTRSSMIFGTPSEAVNRKKQANIIKLAQIYLKHNNLLKRNVRFDVVEIYVDRQKDEFEVKNINLIKNAF